MDKTFNGGLRWQRRRGRRAFARHQVTNPQKRERGRGCGEAEDPHLLKKELLQPVEMEQKRSTFSALVPPSLLC